jgi:hypothetical protein
MKILDLFRKKVPVDLELQRREHLQKVGRIADGMILDTATTELGEVVYYTYNVQGAEFESSEILTEDKLERVLNYSPGAGVGVKFDPRNHGNSILV